MRVTGPSGQSYEVVDPDPLTGARKTSVSRLVVGDVYTEGMRAPQINEDYSRQTLEIVKIQACPSDSRMLCLYVRTFTGGHVWRSLFKKRVVTVMRNISHDGDANG